MKRLLIAASFLVASSLTVSARADEYEVSVAENIPATSAEVLIIEQPLGKLSVSGWDKPTVKIVARKHAPDGATLDRLKVQVEIRDGKIRVKTGVRVGNTFRTLPTAGGAGAGPGIDLTIDAPRRVQLHASTWSGDLEAAGFRSGADLETRGGGEVVARDIEGRVRTSALKGRQRLSAIHGDVEADGVTGDVELTSIDGETLDAHVVDGQITAREVRTPVVRLLSTSGGVIFIGTLRAGGRYELTSMDGDVRMQLRRAPFTLEARGRKVSSGFPVRGGTATATALSGEFQGGGPSLVLTAAHGAVAVDPF
jgi:hypothetical protein